MINPLFTAEKLIDEYIEKIKKNQIDANQAIDELMKDENVSEYYKREDIEFRMQLEGIEGILNTSEPDGITDDDLLKADKIVSETHEMVDQIRDYYNHKGSDVDAKRDLWNKFTHEDKIETLKKTHKIGDDPVSLELLKIITKDEKEADALFELQLVTEENK